jgi:hypothetical protein
MCSSIVITEAKRLTMHIRFAQSRALPQLIAVAMAPLMTTSRMMVASVRVPTVGQAMIAQLT